MITIETMNNKEIWWKKYRYVKHKARPQLHLVAIFWKSFKDNMREYVKQPSLSIISKLFGDGIRMTERLMWAVLFSLSCILFGFYVAYLAIDNISNPLIVSLASTNYPISEIDFPAVAVCSINRISKEAVKIVARDIQGSSPYFRNALLEDIEEFVKQTGRLLDFSYDDYFINHFEYLINSPNHATFDSDRVIGRMEQLAPNCSMLIQKCSWATFFINCNELFTIRRTARGHCCVFNYVLERNSAGSKESSNTVGIVKKQALAGSHYGLGLVLDPIVNDYAYPVRSLEGFELFIFDPSYYPDPSTGRIAHRTVQANEIGYFQLHSTKQEAAPEVRKYPAHIRKCLFKDEKPEIYKDMYSYSACLVQCRIKTFLKLCRCVPYFLPTDIQAPNCTVENLHCLNKFRDKFFYLFPRDRESSRGLEEELQDSLDCPDCLPDCEFTRYDLKSFWTPVEFAHYPNKAIEYEYQAGLNKKNVCVVMLYHPTLDGVLNRLDVVSYWYEMLSNVGGLAGMLVGFSLWSIVEIVYYFGRFFVVFWNNFKIYH